MVTTTLPPINEPEKQAQELAERLRTDLRNYKNTELLRPSETRYSLLADVEFAIEELRYFLLSADNNGVKIPCIKDGDDTVPIVKLPFALGRRLQPPFKTYPPAFPLGVPSNILSELFGGSKCVFSHPSDIPDAVLSPLTKFLTVRFKWVAGNPEFKSLGAASSAQANNPYLPFIVKTNTKGLRIHYSKTFAFNFSNVFGAPTTPLKGWILPGIHKFAGMDGAGNFHYDLGTFTTPPDFSAQLIM